MDKRKLGTLFGVSSLLTVFVSIIVFFTERGPNADVSFVVLLFFILSIIGILCAILSAFMTKRYPFLIIGLLGNGAVLITAFLLQLAMGISEP